VDQLSASKASVTRALDHLEDLDLAYREIDDRDRRSVLVHRTLRGTAMMQRLGTVMAIAAADDTPVLLGGGEYATP
jgi:DNA-binding MarR family transcriptional regulator